MRKEFLPRFQQCPGCSYSFLTGEGSRSCAWFECPYLPAQYEVFCPACNFNFATREGEPFCRDFSTCTWASEGFRHAGQLRRALKTHTVS